MTKNRLPAKKVNAMTRSNLTSCTKYIGSRLIPKPVTDFEVIQIIVKIFKTNKIQIILYDIKIILYNI